MVGRVVHRADAAVAPAGPDLLAPARRLFEWVWRGQALRAARTVSVPTTSRVSCERARIATEVAEQVLAPGPWLSGRADHLAAALFVESIGWSLRALDALQGASSAAAMGPPHAAELEQLLDSSPRLLKTASLSELDQVRHVALERRFEAPGRPIEETERQARLLSRVARRLLNELSPAHDAVERVLRQRLLRCLAVVACLAAAAQGTALLRGQWERRADLAADKPWVASSSYETVCRSPQQHCSDRSFFFHTKEQANPWLELDLLSEQQVSSVHVFNRRDCCRERALPLIIEVSTDRTQWREVMRKNESFGDWRARFTPTTARWIRLRVAQRSFLHLAEVRVFG